MGSRDDDGLLDPRLDELLALRVRAHSDLPGLSGKVMSSIEAKARAEEWLRRNGSLLRRQSAADTLRRALNSYPLAAAAGGALAGWLLAICVPAPRVAEFSAWIGHLLLPSWRELVPQAMLLSVVLALAGAAASVLASQWQQVREYYSWD